MAMATTITPATATPMPTLATVLNPPPVSPVCVDVAEVSAASDRLLAATTGPEVAVEGIDPIVGFLSSRSLRGAGSTVNCGLLSPHAAEME